MEYEFVINKAKCPTGIFYLMKWWRWDNSSPQGICTWFSFCRVLLCLVMSQSTQVRRITLPAPGQLLPQCRGLSSLNGNISYRKISWSLEAARFMFRLLYHYNYTSTPANPRPPPHPHPLSATPHPHPPKPPSPPPNAQQPPPQPPWYQYNFCFTHVIRDYVWCRLCCICYR